MADAARKADDPAYATNLDLVTAVRADVVARLAAGLPKTRAAVGVYLNGALPVDNVALTPAVRKQYREAYAKVAACLGEVK